MRRAPGFAHSAAGHYSRRPSRGRRSRRHRRRAPLYVPDYLVFAILATVLCCLPAGIPGIVYAAQVNGKLQAGDIAGAQSASQNAKMWCWISFGLGLAFCVIYGLLMAAGIMRHMNR